MANKFERMKEKYLILRNAGKFNVDQRLQYMAVIDYVQRNSKMKLSFCDCAKKSNQKNLDRYFEV